MLDKFYVASITQYDKNGNRNIENFNVLMAERHRKKFLEFIDDIISTKNQNPIEVNQWVNFVVTKFQFSDIRYALIHAESNEFFIGSCLRLNIGVNLSFGLKEDISLLALHPIIANLNEGSHITYSELLPFASMPRREYLENIAPKYNSAFFKFSKEDVARLMIIKEIGRNP